MNKMGKVSSADLIDAKMEEHQLCGSKQCPACGHKFEGKPDWLGLPAGVKFDPTDQELIEHLEAKVEAKNMKSHPLIDEFIPTIDGEDGICYTHPEKLPGVSRDGLSRHFFHRPSKAYTTGTRKRRKIQNECDQMQGGETRWHKTGKTRPVTVNGKQKGCKKILVLYTNFGKNRKPEKTNWVMHQYHLGQHEEEKEGELVVSKIFYQTQPRQCNNNWSERSGEASGSCSSNKEFVTHSHRDDQMSAVAGVPPPISSYAPLDIQQIKADHFSFIPFRKGFDEVGIGGEASTGREVQGATSAGSSICEEVHEQRNVAHHHHHQQQQLQLSHYQHHNIIATNTAFHISRPSLPISTVITPPPLHHTSVILDDHVSSSIMLQNDNFQQQHHKLGGARSASGLEELIMGCTSNDMKGESSITNPQEAEWLKYSSYWPDPGNPNHHG